MSNPDSPPQPVPRVAYAWIRGQEKLYIAQDEEVLTRVIIKEVVAAVSPGQYPPGSTEAIREALRRQDWPEAIAAWIELTGNEIDSFPDEIVWTHAALDEDRLGLELAVAAVFDDPGPA